MTSVAFSGASASGSTKSARKAATARFVGALDDGADASASDLEQDFGLALAEMATQALRHVDRALARLERGNYGFCTDCNEKISHKRLTALPFAVRCRQCEELHESAEPVQRFSARADDSLRTFLDGESVR